MEPRESVRYELKLVDAEGRVNRVPPRFTIDVYKNQPPQIKATFPNRDLSAVVASRWECSARTRAGNVCQHVSNDVPMQHLRSVLSLYRRPCERFGSRSMTHRGNQCLLRFVRSARLLRRGGGDLD